MMRGCDHTTIATCAMNVEVLVFFQHGEATRICHFRERNILCTLNMTICKFSFPSYIHHLEILIEWKVHSQFIGFHIDDHVYFFTSLLPCFKSTFEITFYFGEAHSGEANNSLSFFTSFCYQNNGFVERKKAAGPFSKAAFEANADGVGNKACSEYGCFPGIEHNHIFIALKFFEGRDAECLQSFVKDIVEAVVTFFIDARIDGEILRGHCEPISYCADEFFARLRLQCIIAFLLFTDGAMSFRAEIFAAAAAGAMRRIYDHIFGKCGNFVL